MSSLRKILFLSLFMAIYFTTCINAKPYSKDASIMDIDLDKLIADSGIMEVLQRKDRQDTTAAAGAETTAAAGGAETTAAGGAGGAGQTTGGKPPAGTGGKPPAGGETTSKPGAGGKPTSKPGEGSSEGTDAPEIKGAATHITKSNLLSGFAFIVLFWYIHLMEI